jgi:3-deoxy-D-manno-octulosonate 8-phosphate phosphatase (KDO 8-P phosphatase)
VDGVVILTDDELCRRAQRIRLVVSDVDGVLTDAGVYYSERGEEMKRFSLRDGMGVERLRDAGIETAFLTRERSAIVQARANKLKIRYVWLGVHDKRERLAAIERETAFRPHELAYIGDDVNDVEIMRAILDAGGLTASPSDAHACTEPVTVVRARFPGGHGAFRDFADELLRLRG